MLKGRIDAYDPRPTEGVKDRLQELMTEWQERKVDMQKIIREEVDGFNRKYKESDVDILILPNLDGKA